MSEDIKLTDNAAKVLELRGATSIPEAADAAKAT